MKFLLVFAIFLSMNCSQVFGADFKKISLGKNFKSEIKKDRKVMEILNHYAGPTGNAEQIKRKLHKMIDQVCSSGGSQQKRILSGLLNKPSTAYMNKIASKIVLDEFRNVARRHLISEAIKKCKAYRGTFVHFYDFYAESPFYFCKENLTFKCGKGIKMMNKRSTERFVIAHGTGSQKCGDANNAGPCSSFDKKMAKKAAIRDMKIKMDDRCESLYGMKLRKSDNKDLDFFQMCSKSTQEHGGHQSPMGQLGHWHYNCDLYGHGICTN